VGVADWDLAVVGGACVRVAAQEALAAAPRDGRQSQALPAPRGTVRTIRIALLTLTCGSSPRCTSA
jgi:hypothetical protein